MLRSTVLNDFLKQLITLKGTIENINSSFVIQKLFWNYVQVNFIFLGKLLQNWYLYFVYIFKDNLGLMS